MKTVFARFVVDRQRIVEVRCPAPVAIIPVPMVAILTL
jgi:hypothetical protein